MSQRACPFASPSVVEHLARGSGAAALLVLAYWLFHGDGAAHLVAAAASLAGAVALMRGCPTCWTIGLVATIGTAARRARQATEASSDLSSSGSPRPAPVPAPR